MENEQGHYHLHYRKFTRSDGKSAVEAAAYRLAARLHDERTGITHDYTAKRGVTDTILLHPTGQRIPNWVNDPEQLWNKVEAAEKNNPRSLVMHEHEIALPADLTREQRRDLAVEFGQFIADRYGSVAQIGVHQPNREGDHRNHHIHLMFTPRAITEQGFSAKKFRHYSRREPEARRDGEMSGREEIIFIRKSWAEIGNKHLKAAGQVPNLDHRSYEDQGIDKIPQKHLGPQATAKERRGELTAKGDFNRAAEDRNKRREAWAKAWEQAAQEITGEPLPVPDPPPETGTRTKLPFAQTTNPQPHQSPMEVPGFGDLMNNQKTERTSLVQIHAREKDALWRAQQELRNTQKKEWAALYHRQAQEYKNLQAEFKPWTARLMRNLDRLGIFSPSHEEAHQLLEFHQKQDRILLGARQKHALQKPAVGIFTKDEEALRKSHKKEWAILLSRQKEDQAALKSQYGGFTARFLRKLHHTPELQKTQQAAILAQKQRHEIERAALGRRHKKATRDLTLQLESKHRADLTKLDRDHITQRQEFLTRAAQRQQWVDRLQGKGQSHDKDRGRGRER